MLWKWCKRIALGFLCLIAISLVAGASYQFISTKIDERTYPPPGQMVDVGGYKLHLYKSGSGGPVVVLDSGLGCISSDWGSVQSDIAKFIQVVSYDRAGTAWSEASPFPRTSEQIVQELRTLLHKAHIPKPYILVGHSFGGGNAQLYAATYPDEVLGIVLVDSCHEEQEKRLPPHPLDQQMKLMQSRGAVYFMSTFGISRLMAKMYLKSMMPDLPEAMQNRHIALCSTTKHGKTVSAEASSLTESLKQLENVDRSRIQDIPCCVLTAGRKPDLSEFGMSEEQQKFIDKMYLVWQELQNELAAKFEHSKHLIAEKSDHMIPWHQPEIIVQAVKEILNGSR